MRVEEICLRQEIRQIDVACTLCARDYKGLDNYGSNGYKWSD